MMSGDFIKSALAAASLAAAVAGCATLPPPTPEATNVPYRIDYGGLFVAPVRINGKGPYDFIVDTGATATVIYENARRSLDLTPSDEQKKFIHGVAESGFYPVVNLDSISVGDANMPSVDAVLLPDWNEQRHPGGILGLDFLNRHIVVFNTKHQTLDLYPPDADPRALFSGWRRIALKPDQSLTTAYPLMFFDVFINNVRMEAILDTGATIPIINWAGAVRLGLRQTYRNLRKRWRIQGATGTFAPEAILRADGIQADQLAWRSVTLLVKDTPPLTYLGREDVPLVIMSAGFFDKNDFAINFAEPAVYVRPAKEMRGSTLPTSVIQQR